MNYRQTHVFVSHDKPVLTITPRLYENLCLIYRHNGTLFWCNEGEWRAIGGSQLQQQIENLRDLLKMTSGPISVPDILYYECINSFSWDEALPVPTELVRWLRQDTQQLGETDAATESAAE